MSNHLGRPLRKHERVHHKNGIRNDNRLENLVLWTISHPYGQRLEDKISWAKDFLIEYEYEVTFKGKKNGRPEAIVNSEDRRHQPDLIETDA